MIQMTLARIVKVLEFTPMITQQAGYKTLSLTLQRNEDMKNSFILVIHF